jgi:hypothetical protein
MPFAFSRTLPSVVKYFYHPPLRDSPALCPFSLYFPAPSNHRTLATSYWHPRNLPPSLHSFGVRTQTKIQKCPLTPLPLPSPPGPVPLAPQKRPAGPPASSSPSPSGFASSPKFLVRATVLAHPLSSHDPTPVRPISSAAAHFLLRFFSVQEHRPPQTVNFERLPAQCLRWLQMGRFAPLSAAPDPWPATHSCFVLTFLTIQLASFGRQSAKSLGKR